MSNLCVSPAFTGWRFFGKNTVKILLVFMFLLITDISAFASADGKNYMQSILQYRDYNMQKFLSTLPPKAREQFEQKLKNSEENLRALQQQN
ncbi:MAG: hypothetical protein QXV17_08170 [Candidatus Micrarchaeaceae archaeon]